MKKLFAALICFLLAFSMALPTFADTSFVTSKSIGLLPFVKTQNTVRADAPHGYHFRREAAYEGTHTVLNLSTSAEVVPSGTKVTLWQATGHSSQEWFMEWKGRLNNNEEYAVIRPNTNRTLALQADRSYVGIACNVIPSSSNVSNDYTIKVIGDQSESHRHVLLSLQPRSNHLYTVYVTPNSLGSNCTWNYSGGSQDWYMIDGASY